MTYSECIKFTCTLHVVQLPVEPKQRLIISVKVGIYNYCFIRVNGYMLVFVMVFFSRFGDIV